MRIGFVCFILSIPMLTSAYFYQLDILKNSNATVKALSDYHDKDHGVTQDQKNYLKNYLTSCPRASTKLIIEDLHSVMRDSPEQGVLAGLALYCADHGMSVKNIEYRVKRVKALGEFVYQSHKNPYDCVAACSITIGDLSQEIEQAIHAVLELQLPVLLQAVAKKTINEIRKNIAALGWEDTRKTVADYLAELPQKERLQHIKKILMCDVKLLDLHIVGHVLAEPCQNIIICAGGSHIDHVRQLLKKVGYKTFFSTKTTFFTETDLSRCVTATIYHNSYCLKPHPVNLNLLRYK